jgi:glycosyltransferase involved in cell wall biosynthesis
MNDKPDFSPRLAFVIPTKDRPESLRQTLAGLVEQTRRPDLIAVVSSGSMERQYEEVVRAFTEIKLEYRHAPSASASGARNIGLGLVKEPADLIAFLDDDVALDPDAIEVMLNFWRNAPDDVGGAGFNFRNVLAPETERKWALGPVKAFYRILVGEAANKPGKVLPSGFPTPIYPAKQTMQVDWLETVAVVFRREVAENYKFDEFYAGYSYLEFLDYTYSIGKRHKLYVVSGAWGSHYSAPIRNSYLLGKKQVLNRIYFVRKHPELSLPRCLGALVLHTGFNVAVGVMLRDKGYFQRAWGNLAGFAQVATGRLDPVGGGIK